MVARLQPIDLSGYIAGNALAARLTAQAGESIGQGIESIGTGIASGINAGTARRERAKEWATEESHFQQTRQDRLAENARDDARYEAQLQINSAERSQAAVELQLGKIEKEKQDRLMSDPNADLSDLLDREKSLTTAHSTQEANKAEVISALHTAAHPECAGGKCYRMDPQAMGGVPASPEVGTPISNDELVSQMRAGALPGAIKAREVKATPYTSGLDLNGLPVSVNPDAPKSTPKAGIGHPTFIKGTLLEKPEPTSLGELQGEIESIPDLIDQLKKAKPTTNSAAIAQRRMIEMYGRRLGMDKAAHAKAQAVEKADEKATQDAAEGERKAAAAALEAIGSASYRRGEPPLNDAPEFTKGYRTEEAKALGEKSRGEIVTERGDHARSEQFDYFQKRKEISDASREEFAQKREAFHSAEHDKTLDAAARKAAKDDYDASLKSQIAEEKSAADAALALYKRITDPKKSLIGEGQGKWTSKEASDVYKEYEDHHRKHGDYLREQESGQAPPSGPSDEVSKIDPNTPWDKLTPAQQDAIKARAGGR